MSDLYNKLYNYDTTKRELLSPGSSIRRIASFRIENLKSLSKHDVDILNTITSDAVIISSLLWVEHEQLSDYPCLYYDGTNLKLIDSNNKTIEEVLSNIAGYADTRLLICLQSREYYEALEVLNDIADRE